MEPDEQLQEQPTNGQHVLENPIQSAEIQIHEEHKHEISLVSGIFFFFFPLFFFLTDNEKIINSQIFAHSFLDMNPNNPLHKKLSFSLIE